MGFIFCKVTLVVRGSTGCGKVVLRLRGVVVDVKFRKMVV